MKCNFVYSKEGRLPEGSDLDALMLLRNAVKFSQIDFFESVVRLNFSLPQRNQSNSLEKELYPQVIESGVESGDIRVVQYLLEKIYQLDNTVQGPSGSWRRAFHHAGLLGTSLALVLISPPLISKFRPCGYICLFALDNTPICLCELS